MNPFSFFCFKAGHIFSFILLSLLVMIFFINNFCLPHIKYITPLFLASLVSNKEVAVNRIEDPQYVRSCFSSAFKILSLLFNNWTIMCFSVDPFDFYLSWNLLSYLHVQINSDMGGFKSFLQIFFLFLSLILLVLL